MIMLGTTPAIAITSPEELEVLLSGMLGHAMDLRRHEESVRRLGDSQWADHLKRKADVAQGLVARLKTIKVEMPAVIVELPQEPSTERNPNVPATESQGSPVAP